MAWVRGSAGELHDKARRGDLHREIARKRWELLREPSTGPEFVAWKNSLEALLSDLVAAGLAHVDVLVEYKLPLTSKRVDAVLCGTSPDIRDPVYVLVELKQWSDILRAEGDRVYLFRSSEARLHPLKQLDQYREYLVDQVSMVADHVHGFAYLHNASRALGDRLRSLHPGSPSQLFTQSEQGALRRALRGLIDPDPSSRTDAAEAADDLLNVKAVPAPTLLRSVSKDLRRRDLFVLLDEQRVAYDLVMRAVERARTARQQTVVIIVGGPGSGKSAIALSLLSELTKTGHGAYHATGSKSFTNTLRRYISAGTGRSEKVFKFFFDFSDARPKQLDVLICDEAHRIRRESTNNGGSRNSRRRLQVEELIDAALVTVFLLDEHQAVRPNEQGKVSRIEHAARAADCRVEKVHLEGQFRYGGSRAYDTWVLRLLGLAAARPARWSASHSVDGGFWSAQRAVPRRWKPGSRSRRGFAAAPTDSPLGSVGRGTPRPGSRGAWFSRRT
ncbi:hypothetical protein LX15_005051 [Streptoalloteichus tenebrarius]|uniref:AAA+ ATPase domain-containing protein n=1 Tax=Streptoalloteichus tenebrarius (strain ATCC 17920 / DSM 40477 / JCM 4838 / CBS 697.72 / NBRC 16177 / NCIMB 11028 / NRRL B-12390 / A12253. 1 / ISP 5477) TaxID=1933 RepID=A0ABT1I0P9_STRSD|nr:hypothetical protein [Streptoalloteichus tenebrarius]BFF03730.1 hypothetical protein GCM10020241_54050 [Streptoalloteichus tenebrarius]